MHAADPELPAAGSSWSAPHGERSDPASGGATAPGSDAGSSASDGPGEDPDPVPDPLYDAHADEADAAWVQRRRQGRTTDALLTCPGCFVTVCIDCQQHAERPNQYRAMFVMHCALGEPAAPEPPPAPEPLQTRKRAAPGGGAAAGSAAPPPPEAGGPVRPVSCAVCGAALGTMDSDEVYHFVHALASVP